MKRRLVIETKAMSSMQTTALRTRMAAMLAILDDPGHGKHVDVRQTGPTTPIVADMRAFGLHLQVHPHKGDPRKALADFCRRAVHPSTEWADAGTYDRHRSATQGAWEAVRAMVGDLIDEVTSRRIYGPAPMCDGDACRGPRMINVHHSIDLVVQSAVRHAFHDVPDIAWACSISSGRTVRDFRIGDHTMMFAEVDMPDALTRLRVLAGWKDVTAIAA